MAKLSDLKKVELLESTVLEGNIERVRAVFAQHAPFEFTARALGIACRYVSADMVKCLCELGVTLDFTATPAMARKYNCRVELSHTVSINEDYSRWLLSTPRLEDNKLYGAHPVLSGAERTECARILYENAQKLHFNAQELFYYAALYGDADVFRALKDAGVGSISEYRKGLLNGTLTHNSLGTEGRWHREEIAYAINKSEGDELTAIIQLIVECMNGEKIALAKGAFYQYSFEKSKDSFVDSCCQPSVFMLFVQHTTLLEHVKTWEILEGLIAHNNAEGLGWALAQNMISKPAEYKKLFDLAMKKEAAPAVVACVLKYHNPAAEAEKKPKKKEADEFSLDFNPLSAAELRKLWGTKKNEDGTLQIISYKGEERDVVIPDMIGKTAVTTLGEEVFAVDLPRLTDEQIAARRSIRSVEFPSSIKELPRKILGGSMYGQNEHAALEEIILSEGLEIIGSSAFYCCTGLKEITFPESLKKIDGSAFYGCTQLEKIAIPQSVTQIGVRVFSGCKNLQEVKLPSELTALDNGTFENCTSLKQIDLPKGIRVLPQRIFGNCGFEEFILPEHITAIDQLAFAGCTNLKKVVLHDKLTKIGSYAFAGCPIEEIVIPNSVTEIGTYAFQDCKQLKKVVLPENDIQIGEGAFEKCKCLQDENGLILVQGALHGFEGSLSQPLRLPDAIKMIGERTFQKLPRIVYRETDEKDDLPDFSALNVGDEVQFGRFPQDTSLEMKPLTWQVIAQEGNRRLLLTKEAIIGLSDDYDTKDLFGIVQNKTWSESSARKWLNTVFLSTVFNEEEKTHIPEVLLKNPNNRDVKPIVKGGEDTLDRVFLLSSEELWKHLPQSSMQRASISPYAKAQWEARRNTYFYRLRTPGPQGPVAVSCHLGGCNPSGNHVGTAVLRPAIWVE